MKNAIEDTPIKFKGWEQSHEDYQHNKPINQSIN